MSTNELDTIRLIDQRVRSLSVSSRRKGTISTRDTTGSWAAVRLDGDDSAVPMLVQGHVFCQEGDRVTCDLYGTEWVVTGSLSATVYGYAEDRWSAATEGPMTSATFVDVTTSTPVTFTKYYDLTVVQIENHVASFVSVVNTQVQWGLRFTATNAGSGYAAADYNTALHWHSSTGHESDEGGQRVGGGLVPAGSYTVQQRWRRVTGTGGVSINSADFFRIQIAEQPDIAARFL